tara:strand:- start:267 stop:551 length:285 start_codon:yes stop_codon:yes gene_type:complete
MEFLGDNEYNEFLQTLIDSDHLDGPALGITKKVIKEGIGSLSEKQKFAFQKQVDEYISGGCSRCGADIPWSEMYEAYHNGGMCGWCEHMDGKSN